MTTARPKLSLSDRTEEPERGPSAADRPRAWNVSPARAEKLKGMARNMRLNPTAAEALLWERLQDKGVGGFSFTRQVVVGSSIVDFACRSRWLVVEIDGGEGHDATLAELSDRKLREVGLRVLRFSETQVLEDMEAAVAAILEALQQPFERPRTASPRRDRARP